MKIDELTGALICSEREYQKIENLVRTQKIQNLDILPETEGFRMSRESQRRDILRIIGSMKAGSAEPIVFDINYKISATKKLLSIATKRKADGKYSIQVSIKDGGKESIYQKDDLAFLAAVKFCEKAVIYNDWATFEQTFDKVSKAATKSGKGG